MQQSRTRLAALDLYGTNEPVRPHDSGGFTTSLVEVSGTALEVVATGIAFALMLCLWAIGLVVSGLTSSAGSGPRSCEHRGGVVRTMRSGHGPVDMVGVVRQVDEVAVCDGSNSE